ncbi:hypothetical protein G6Z94_07145 [Vibrio aestuarianus]|uniref:hypothetical protein n=1 Tax=Vibrio aestuarianus TaxID=28171 RepID=UPI0015943A7F|nr:hypothetical protein [Vibrio aestuarianus]NGZ17126.1 hypothetical protein [Vibrio aestuarianus]
MEFMDLVVYISPVISLVLVVLVFFNTRMSSMAKKYEDYKNDNFRQSIEKELYSLQRELSINKERFDSINHLVKDVKYSSANYINKYSASQDAISQEFLNNLGIFDFPEVDPKKIFVLTPFNNEFYSQYMTVKHTVEDLGFKCVRGDDSNISSNILAHVIEEMLSAKIVIANISGRNPNVFYELGIAHALGKPVLLISESLSDIPFDIHSQRILAFRDERELTKNLNKWLIETLLRNKT